MNKLEYLNKIYFELLAKQIFFPESLDYTLFEKQIPELDLLCKVTNSAISIFDCYKVKHIYNKGSFYKYLGYASNSENEIRLDEKIHPEDFLSLMENGIELLKFALNLPEEEKKSIKLINEYRIKDTSDKYVKVIEQHQTLLLDNFGNLWLSLSILDLSPNQNIEEGFKSKLINFKTGKEIPISTSDCKVTVELSLREKEILKLVKKGLLSKEISDKLSISVHTVNTHRQNVLKKLNVNSSIEAIQLASKLGLLE